MVDLRLAWRRTRSAIEGAEDPECPREVVGRRTRGSLVESPETLLTRRQARGSGVGSWPQRRLAGFGRCRRPREDPEELLFGIGDLVLELLRHHSLGRTDLEPPSFRAKPYAEASKPGEQLERAQISISSSPATPSDVSRRDVAAHRRVSICCRVPAMVGASKSAFIGRSTWNASRTRPSS